MKVSLFSVNVSEWKKTEFCTFPINTHDYCYYTLA